MSSRALRRLRQEQEVLKLQEEPIREDEDDNGGSDNDDEDDDGGVVGGGNKAFLMMMDEDSSSSSEEESASESDSDSNENDDDDDQVHDGASVDFEEKCSKTDKKVTQLASRPKTTTTIHTSRSTKADPKQKKQPHPSPPGKDDDEEEDLEAILISMNIPPNPDSNSTRSSFSSKSKATASGSRRNSAANPYYPHLSPFYVPSKPTVRTILLSKATGFDSRDLDLDHAMRSLLGAERDGQLALGGNNANNNNAQNNRGRGRRNNQRGGGRAPRPLAKRYLFGKPRPEWGKPPSFVGGGLGAKELTFEVMEEENYAWRVPWPYNHELDQMENMERMEREGVISYGLDRKKIKSGENPSNIDVSNPTTTEVATTHPPPPSEADANSCNTDVTKTPTIRMSRQRWFTLQMSDTYQENCRLYKEMAGNAGRVAGAGALNDPNALAMFVADYPYLAETILQLAMILYYVNDRGRGNDLLRRCMFLYETALPSTVMPPITTNSNDVDNNNKNNNSSVDSENEILIDVDREPNAELFSTLFRIMQTSGMTGLYPNALAVGRFLLSLDPLRDPMGVLLILDYYALACRRSALLSGGASKEVEMGSAFIIQLVESNVIHIHYMDPLTSRHHWCPLVQMPNWAFSRALALYRLSKNDEAAREEKDSTSSLEHRAEEALILALTRFPMVLPKLLTMNNINTQDRSFRMDWPSILPYFSEDAVEKMGDDNGVEDRVTKAAGDHVVRIFVQRFHKLWAEEDVLQWMYSCADKMVKQRQQQIRVAQSTDSGSNEKQRDALMAHSEDIKAFTSKFSPALARYAQCDPSEYEDAFRTLPPEALALDLNMVAPAMALDPNRRGRFLRGINNRGVAMGRAREDQDAEALLDQLRRVIGRQDDGEMLDPDSPLLQLYLQSLLPWAQVDGVRPPRG